MSHIFDALLKSEAGRADGQMRANARDILMRAERRAAQQRRVDNPAEAIVPSFGEGPDADSSVSLLAAADVAPLLPEPVRDDPMPSFPSIDVTLPLESRIVAVADKTSPAAEAFRLLCVRLRHYRKGHSLRRLLLTSTVPQEGKSFSAANLACTIASVNGDKVLLLEGDLRRPVQSEMFGLAEMPGLLTWLQGTTELSESIHYLNGPNIWLMPAGGTIANPLDLLQSDKVPALLQQLSAWFDWVIVDSPPVLPLADTSVLARLADGILLVTRRGTTEKRWLQRGLDSIEKDKLLGAIINSSLEYHSSYYYYYGAPASQSSPDQE